VKSVKISISNESRALIISSVTCSITITCASPAQRKPRKFMAVGAFVIAEIEKRVAMIDEFKDYSKKTIKLIQSEKKNRPSQAMHIESK
jgi:hypothetical protein